LSKVLTIGCIHPEYKYLTVDIMNGQNVVFVKDSFVDWHHAVQSSFHERIVNTSSEISSQPFLYSHPKVLAPAS
jgi:hypothetical protein